MKGAFHEGKEWVRKRREKKKEAAAFKKSILLLCIMLLPRLEILKIHVSMRWCHFLT